MSLRDRYLFIVQKLKEAKVTDVPDLETRWLIEHFCKIRTNELITGSELSVSQEQLENLEKALAERLLGRPLAYILKEKEFYGRNFFVSEGVLVPRPETEHLVDIALEWTKNNQLNGDKKILDLGAGSGCIGLTLLMELSSARAVLIENSRPAIEVIAQNINNFLLGDKVGLINMSVEGLKKEHLPTEFGSGADIILANPPYIDIEDPSVDKNVVQFEPHAALFADENGFGSIRRWLEVAVPLLKPRGLIAFEIGATQGTKTRALFESFKELINVEVIKDYAQHDRVVWAQKG